MSIAPLFYLAPLRGVTDCIYRNAFERYFDEFDYLLTPFITTLKGREVAPKHLKDILSPENDRARVIPQIIGNDHHDLALLAEHIHRTGYQVVNWNLGCPHKPVTRKRRGSGLLPHPDLVASILEKLAASLSCEISVKVRLGLDDSTDLERLMPVLNDYPLREVIIHPRTGKQGYTGVVDLDRFAAAAEGCIHSVVFNGDIVSLEGFTVLRNRFPRINRWMIGRGALHNPRLLTTLRNGKESSVDWSVLRMFHDTVLSENEKVLFGPAHLLGKMKEFWWYYASNFPSSASVLKRIQRCSSVEQYRRRVDDAFAAMHTT